MTTVKILLILTPKMISRFMQAADVFDNGKVIGEIKEISIDFKEGEIVDFSRIEKLFPVLKTAFESESQYQVQLIHAEQIESEDNILKNNKKLLPYFNPKVRQISDGSKFFLFCDFLKNLGFEVETTQDMYIKNLS